MKTKIMLILTLMLLGSSTSPAHFLAHGGFGISFGVFYSSLSPHGEWIMVDPDVYAWRPLRLQAGWRPYMMGNWVWTDDGWYWNSDEPWGWAVYHYGRWYYDDYYGWVWIPGYDWAPAWVEWRYGGDYIGWAPLGPYAVFSINFGVYYWRHWVTPYDYWLFTDCRYIMHRDIHRYVYRTDHNTRYLGRTRSGGSVRYEGGRTVTRGPDRDFVERRGNIRLERAAITDVNERDQVGLRRMNDREQVQVYRPRVEERVQDGGRERPGQVRESERAISLDSRNLDLRSRERATDEGRDIRRAEQYRPPRSSDTRRDDQPRVQPRRQTDVERQSGVEQMRPRDTFRVPDQKREPIDRPPRHSQQSNRDTRESVGQPPRSERRVERETPQPRRESVERPRYQRDQAPRPQRIETPRSRPDAGQRSVRPPEGKRPEAPRREARQAR